VTENATNSLVLKSDHEIPKAGAFVGPRFVADHNIIADLIKNMRGEGSVDVIHSGDEIVVRGRRSGGGTGCPFFCASINASVNTTVDISEGYGCYAGVFSSLGPSTITGYSGSNGSWYASAKIDFSTGSWSLVKSATVNTLPDNTDSVQHYVLARVTVASSIITAVQQLWYGGWCIYENRV